MTPAESAHIRVLDAFPNEGDDLSDSADHRASVISAPTTSCKDPFRFHLQTLTLCPGQANTRNGHVEFTTRPHRGHLYFTSWVDDKSRKVFVEGMAKKHEAP